MTLGTQYQGAFMTLGTQYQGAFMTLGTQYPGAFMTLGIQYPGAFMTLGTQYQGAAKHCCVRTVQTCCAIHAQTSWSADRDLMHTKGKKSNLRATQVFDYHMSSYHFESNEIELK
jgi:hypothetical protein